uniref:Carbonic anhydrase n=1 Tax=Graphocephala atropunctata TaxID=36148 RepID=A0A1B6MLP7_9HEMI
MTLSNNLDKYITESKNLIREAALKDGKLLSPIDLSLSMTIPLYLDRLEWIQFGNLPSIMKISNTGETVIISAQWTGTSSRPYLAGGPLDDSYVFSQVHFHWGAGEHEGSEHSVDGSCYPLEMHAVFYKSQYHTQDEALKEGDGIVVLVYLCKLKEKSSPGLEWLSSYLNQVVGPKMSTMLPLAPLSSLLVPFTRDYIIYWGSLSVGHCSHVMLWLVSRAALAISLEDLNKFRRLLSSRKEAMNKIIIAGKSTQNRSVFHANPSLETKYFLLPGIVEPSRQFLDCAQNNYTQMAVLDQQQAEQIFSRRCNGDEELINVTHKINPTSKEMEIKLSSFRDDWCKESDLRNVKESLENISRNNSGRSSPSLVGASGTSPTKIVLGETNKIEQTNENIKLNEIKTCLMTDDLCKGSDPKNVKESKEKDLKNSYDKVLLSSHIPSGSSPTRFPIIKMRSGELYLEKLKNNKFKLMDKDESVKLQLKKGVELKRLSSESLVSKTVHERSEILRQPNKKALVSLLKENFAEGPPFKSKLPVRKNHDKPILKSSLVKYFTRPVSAPHSEKSQTESTRSPETEKYKTKLRPSCDPGPEKIKTQYSKMVSKPFGHK